MPTAANTAKVWSPKRGLAYSSFSNACGSERMRRTTALALSPRAMPLSFLPVKPGSPAVRTTTQKPPSAQVKMAADAYSFDCQ